MDVKKNLSAEKRMRQDEKRRVRNRTAKSAIRTSAKKIVVASAAKDKTVALEAFKDMIRKIDSAAHKGIVKKNSAARKKSRMQRLINRIGL